MEPFINSPEINIFPGRRGGVPGGWEINEWGSRPKEGKQKFPMENVFAQGEEGGLIALELAG